LGKLKKIKDIASKARLSEYDSTYLYLSRELSAKLVTMDNELEKERSRYSGGYAYKRTYLKIGRNERTSKKFGYNMYMM